MVTQNIRTLTPNESQLLNTLAGDGHIIFTVQEARATLGAQESQTGQLLHRLTRKRWLFRLERGKYLIVPLEAGMKGLYTVHEFIVAAHLVTPYMIAYASALTFHGLTEQTSTVIFVATTHRRRNVTIPELGLRYRFVTLSEEHFFGFQETLIETQPVIITDPARTLIDALDRPEYCGGIAEAAKGLWRYMRMLGTDTPLSLNASLEQLTQYATRLGNRTVFKRLGYLSELQNLPVDHYLERWHSEISMGMSDLDPQAGPHGDYNTRWRLRINVTPHSLLEWVGH